VEKVPWASIELQEYDIATDRILFASGDIVQFVDWFTNFAGQSTFKHGAVERKLPIAPSAAPAVTGAV
jgi:hypothetical protein